MRKDGDYGHLSTAQAARLEVIGRNGERPLN